MSVLTARGRFHASAERVGHQLHAVTDPQRGNAQIEQLSIDLWRAGIRDASRAAGQNDAGRLSCGQIGRRRRGRKNFGVHRQLSQAACNQLGVLRPEIDDENRLMCH
jgi:hypothetical protein